MTNRDQTDPGDRGESEAWIIPDAGRLEALAEFAAGAGHEINNPLATIIGRAQLLLKDERDPQRRQMLQSIGAQAYRIRDMIGDTMLFARPPKPEMQTVNLRSLFDQVVQRMSDPLTQSGCSVSIEIAQDVTVRADANQVSIVVTEFLRNSQQALQPDGGEILVRAIPTAEAILMEIEDRGKGFTETERIHAFNPFFSGRQAGRGLGFGLSKCWQIVRQHGGRIEIESAPGGPTIVHVAWPVAKDGS